MSKVDHDRYGTCHICGQPNAPVVVMDGKTRAVVEVRAHEHGRTLASDAADLRRATMELGRVLREEIAAGRAFVRFVYWLNCRLS